VIHIGATLGRGLAKGDGPVIRIVGRLLLAHLAALQVVALVAHQLDIDPVRAIAMDLLQPAIDALETAGRCGVVDEQDAMGTAIVGRQHRLEALLAGGVPDLELHHLAGHLHGAHLEVHAHRAQILSGKLAVREAHQQTGLAHAAVPQDEDLEQVLVVAHHRQISRKG